MVRFIFSHIIAATAALLFLENRAHAQTDSAEPSIRYRNPLEEMSPNSATPVRIRIKPAWKLSEQQMRTALMPPKAVIGVKSIRYLYPEDIEPTPEQQADGSALTATQRTQIKKARKAAVKEAMWRRSIEAELYNQHHSTRLAETEKKGRHIIIKLGEQKGYLMQAEQTELTFDICSGKDSTPTPTGHFHIQEKRKEHRSNLYRSEMPFFMRLSADGVGLHQGPIRKKPSSHGCIRLHKETAEFLFNQCDIGTAVFIEN